MTTSLSRKTLGNATVLAIGTALEAVLQLLFLLIAGRELGPEEFGFYGYLLALVTLGATLAHYGLQVIAVREIVRRPGEEPSLFAATFRIRGILSLVFFAAAILISLFVPLTESHRIAVWLIFLYLLCVPFDLSFLFDAHKLSRWDVPGKLAGRITSVGLLLILWQTRDQLAVSDIALCTTLLMVVNIAAGWTIAKRIRLPLPFWGATKDTRPLAMMCVPIVWSNLMMLSYTQNQTILVKAFSSALETGFYALTSRLLTPILILKGILYRVLVPIFSESVSDPVLLTVRLEKIIPILGLIFFPIAALAIPAAEVLIVPLFGKNYAGAVLPFQVSVAIFFISGIGAAFGSVVLAGGDARTPTIGLTLGTGIAVGLSILTIPAYGATGAAVAAGIGEFIANIYPIPKFLRMTRPVIVGRLMKIGTASIAGLIGFYLLRPVSAVPAFVSLGIAIFITVVGLWLAGEISRDHLSALWQLIRKPAPAASESEQEPLLNKISHRTVFVPS